MTKYEELIQRKRAEYGDRFDPSDLNPGMVEYFNAGSRVRVRFDCGEEKTGRIGVTTGWRPVFLLMLSSRARGSSWTIGPKSRVTAIQGGRRGYVPVPEVQA